MTMFTLQEAALAYAKAAECVLGQDSEFINQNQELVPVFTLLLFQSIEISLKHLGIAAGLFTEQESRDRKLTKNGHGVKEIADLVNRRLGANSDYPVLTALTVGLNDGWESEILEEMVYGSDLEATRKAYESRNLGYANLHQGDFALVQGLKPWATAVRSIAENLPKAVEVVKQWNASSSSSKHFAIWYK